MRLHGSSLCICSLSMSNTPLGTSDHTRLFFVFRSQIYLEMCLHLRFLEFCPGSGINYTYSLYANQKACVVYPRLHLFF